MAKTAEDNAFALNEDLVEAGLYGLIVATTSPQGANNADKCDLTPLYGKRVVIFPDNNTAGHKYKNAYCKALTGHATARVIDLPDRSEGGDYVDFRQAGHSFKEAHELIEAALQESENSTATSAFKFSTDEALDNILTGIEWEWENYIPRGFVTALVADQDQGKSTVAQNLCDIILRGTQWPDGQPHTPRPNARLLWIDTGGAIAIFHQRIKAWDMPPGRFILPQDPLQELAVDDESWAWIEEAIRIHKPPLVVIDALSGAHRSRENASDDMKIVMKRLADLAKRYQIAVLVIHHLNKPQAGVPNYPMTLHRLRGSSAISQYCRSIIALGTPDPAQPENRRLDVIKLNLAKKPKPVGYTLTDKGPAWGKAPEPPKARRAVDDAVDFLESALQNGPRLSNEINAEAKENGIGESAVKDAKKVLKVKTERNGGKSGHWCLCLPEDGEESEDTDN